MIISHLFLRNWKNFQDVELELGERVFLIGPNASGKSNLLDALRFCHDIVKPGGGLKKAVQDRGGLSKIRCLSARQYPDVEIKIVLSGSDQMFKYSIGLSQEPRGRRNTVLTHEKVWRNDVAILDRPNQSDNEDPLLLTQTHLEQINSNKSFREIADFFNSISYRHLVPQLIRSPSKPLGYDTIEDPFGQNFLDTVARTSERVRKARLRKIENALQIAIPQLKQLSLVKDESGMPHLEAVYAHWRASGAKQREDQFSDGTLRLIGFLWSLLDSDSLLLLEEPELSLNAASVRELPGIIGRIQEEKNNQVIISTHSPELMTDEGLALEEVFILTPNEEGTRIEKASSVEEIKALRDNGMSLADAVFPGTAPKETYKLHTFE